MTTNVPDLLVTTAGELKKLDLKIAEMAALADFRGRIRITIPGFGTNASWEGTDDTVSSAINTVVSNMVQELVDKKAAVVQEMMDMIAVVDIPDCADNVAPEPEVEEVSADTSN